MTFWQSVASSFGGLLGQFWPILLFIVLLPTVRSTALFWRQEKFKKELEWVLLELRIPREILQQPRAMEQALTAFRSMRNVSGDFKEEFLDGEVTRWFSLEIASFGGEVHYYVRLYKKYRPLVEAAIFSYYPDVEIAEVEDYVNRFPDTVEELETQGYEMWSTEMILAKEGCYPIRTYKDFEDMEEERQFDPMSIFLEVLAKLKKEEFVGIQILLTPIGDDWHKAYEPEVARLKEIKMKKNPDTGDLIRAFGQRTPGETDVLKALEHNMSLPAFNTLIRFIYLSPKGMFYDSYPRRGLIGSFNQYGQYDLNFFRENRAVSTRTRIWNRPFIFPKTRAFYRKARLLYNYRARKNPVKPWMGKLISAYLFNWNFASHYFIMTTECVATLFHPPTSRVLTAPHVQRVESKKGGPPAGLAIFGDDSDIDRFM